MTKEISDIRKIAEENGFYIMKKEDVPRFAETCAKAFIGYPLFIHFFKRSDNYEHVYEAYKNLLYVTYDDSVVYSESAEGKSMVQFVRTGFHGTDVAKYIKNCSFKMIKLFKISGLIRMIKSDDYAMKLKKKFTNHKDVYLYNLTTNPEFQKQGLASKLLAPAFKYLDENNLMTYLETYDEKNVSFYEGKGFELKSETLIPGSNVTHFSFLRMPKH